MIDSVAVSDYSLQTLGHRAKANEGYKMKFDYIKEAHRTLSGEFHGDKVGVAFLGDTLGNAIKAADELDGIKKALYYGKSVNGRLIYNGDIPATKLKEHGYSVDLIHGIIGAHTESAELLAALSNALYDDTAFDTVNIKEEVGDLLWYLAIIAKACDFTLEDAQQVNIAKLRARYPDKFTEDKAIDRDLTAERNVLETRTAVETVGDLRYTEKLEILESANNGVAKRLMPQEADALIKEANGEKI